MSKNGKSFWRFWSKSVHVEQTVPENKKSISPADRTVPESGSAAPRSNQTMPDMEERVQDSGRKVSRSSGNETVPESFVRLPVSRKAPDLPSASLRFEKGSLLMGSYRIESDPIKGGMGSVWRVRHIGWAVDLAMKRPLPEMFATESSKAGFIGECRSWINLGLHPNIVSCYYVREIGGVPTIFSEWMENGSLENRIMDGTLYQESEPQLQRRLLDIAIQYARGLHYAHEAGLIHQDVKPDNLLLTKDWHAKAADFGLAKARAQLTVLEGAQTLEDAGATILTPAGGYTPAYCSMEQMDGKQLTRRTDIYSWAVSVLEMYYGSRPWSAGPAAGLSCTDYFDQCRVAPSASLRKLLSWCLAMKPEDRPHDFAAVGDELLRIWRESFGEDYFRPEPTAAADTPDSLNNQALSYLDLGMRERAEALWEQALAADPAHLDSIYNQGLLLWRNARITDLDLLDRLNAANDRLRASELAERIRMEQDASLPEPFGSAQCSDDAQICFSADAGRVILSGADGGDFRVLNAETGEAAGCVKTGGAETGLAVLSGSDPDIFWSSGADALVRYSLREQEPTDFFANDSDRQRYFSFALDQRERKAVVLLRERRKIGEWEVPKAELWDLAGDRRLWSVSCSLGGRVFMSSDGRRFAAFSSDQFKPSIEVWDAARHQTLVSLPGHTGRILDLAVDQNFEFACTVSLDGTIRRWNLIAETLSRQYDLGPMSGSEQLYLLPDGSLMILNCGEHHLIRFLDPGTGRFFSTVGTGTMPLQICAAVHPRNGTVLVTCADHRIYRFRLPHPTRRAEASLSSIGNTEALLAREKAFRQYLEEAGKALHSNAPGKAAACLRKARSQIGFEAHPDALALARELGAYCRIDRLQGVLKTGVMKGHESAPRALAIHPNGRYAVSSCGFRNDRQVLLWDLEESIWVWLVASPIRSGALAFSPDGGRILVHTSDDISSYTFVDRPGLNPDGKKLRPYARPEESWKVGTASVRTLLPTPDGKHFLAGFGGSFSIFRIGSSKPILTREVESLHSLLLSTDGQTILAGCSDGKLRRYRFPDGQELSPFRVGSKALCLSPDGHLIAAVDERACSILDAETGKIQSVLSGIDALAPFCFSHDSRFLWRIGESGEILLCSLEDGSAVSRIPGPSAKITALAADPSGIRLLAGCSDHRILNLELDWDYR